MSRIKVAVCDGDEIYRRRFVTYLMEHNREEMEVHAISLPGLLREEMEKKTFGLILLGEGFADMKEEVEKRKIPLLFLSEEALSFVAEESGFGESERTPTACIFKYQPMENILHEMRALAAGGGDAYEAECKRLPGLEVIGVYSPVKHEMQMPFSIIFANAIADQRKVLYINLMEYSGFPELFGRKAECDLGDIVTRIRKNRLLPEIFMRSVYEMGKVSYIPPFANPENLTEFGWEDYKGILKFLEEKTDFETAVIDFGQGVKQFAEMLGACSSVYCPVKNGYFYECCRAQFINYIKTASGELSEEKIHLFELPFLAKGIHGGSNVFEQLMWSEFGDYVRNYLTGGIH